MGTIPSLKAKGEKELQVSDVDDGSSAAEKSQLEVDDQSENNES